MILSPLILIPFHKEDGDDDNFGYLSMAQIENIQKNGEEYLAFSADGTEYKISKRVFDELVKKYVILDSAQIPMRADNSTED